jgi:peptidoglycan hydrolase CwlO-like protein
LLIAAPAGGQSESSLRNNIDKGKAAERALGSAAERLGKLEAAAARAVSILEGRVAEAQSELDRAVAAADRAEVALGKARARVARLKIRLSEVTGQLARILRERYMGDKPDLVTVVLESTGFSQLLETLDYLKTIQRRDAMIVGLVRSAKADAKQERARLVVLTKRRQETERAVRQRRDALASIAEGLRARRDALARAHAARLAALSSVRSRRIAAEKTLTKLIAERERASLLPGPGGPWAIPWAIVQCESGGQNLPPNWAGASGYYQFMPATWHGLGGSTPNAYQASKAEQDRLAARLWAGGAGARNWVCAGIVGII